MKYIAQNVMQNVCDNPR